mgnify:CR=1 FL=1
MKQYLFSAIFYKEDDKFIVLFPDLGITIDGDTIEDAYLFAKESLRVYCTYAEKFDIEIEMPSRFEDVLKKNPRDLVMLVDCLVW